MNHICNTNRLIAVLFVVCTLIISFGCANQAGANFDTSGYDLEPIKGSAVQIARKYEGSNLIEEGLIKNGRKEGTWIQYHPKRKGHIDLIQNYSEGKLNGAMLTFDAKGSLLKMVQYIDGSEHGQSIQYNFGKVTDISPYKYGLLDGTFESFYGDEKIQQQIEYQKGKKEGALRYFDEAGNITVEYRYQNDEKIDGGMVNPEQ